VWCEGPAASPGHSPFRGGVVFMGHVLENLLPGPQKPTVVEQRLLRVLLAFALFALGAFIHSQGGLPNWWPR
jgi:hypothetical protein